jgi:undecaprenyl-diphosphatase
MNYFHAIILGIIEGLTEFLPISSTGHLIAASRFFNLEKEAFVNLFEIFIQLGAILAVVILYRKKIQDTFKGLLLNNNNNNIQNKKNALKFTLNVCIATFPAAILGLFFNHWFKDHFFNIQSVAIALIIGGCIILYVDGPFTTLKASKTSNTKHVYKNIDDISIATAVKIGLFQCLALMPGTSRSGATIIGSMLLGVPRFIATEFSFFLAIPIILGASLHDLYKSRHLLNIDSLGLLLIGSIVAFITAWICIKWLMKYVSSHNFIAFAWYRIIFGILLLVVFYK